MPGKLVASTAGALGPAEPARVSVSDPSLRNGTTFGVSSASEFCTSEIRAGELRAGEVCLSEVRLAEDRAGEVRAGEDRAVKLRAGESRVDEVRIGEVCVAEIRAVEVQAAEECATEIRAAEERVVELRAAEVRLAEARVVEDRAAEDRAAKVRPAEVRADQLCAAEVRAVKGRAGKIRIDKVRAGQRGAGKIDGAPVIVFAIAAPNDRDGGLHIRTRPPLRRLTARFGFRPPLTGMFADDGGQDLYHRGVVAGGLAGHSFQGIDAADTDVKPLLGVELLDRLGIAVGHLPLRGEFEGAKCQLTSL